MQGGGGGVKCQKEIFRESETIESKKKMQSGGRGKIPLNIKLLQITDVLDQVPPREEAPEINKTFELSFLKVWTQLKVATSPSISLLHVLSA